MSDSLALEAEAFNKRITERVSAGFIPDLQNAVPCHYFYKSMFRDPHYMQLYFNRGIGFYLEHIKEHFNGKKISILDVGCGPGIVTLELARNGHNVLGIDIADAAISKAAETAKNYFDKASGGQINYKQMSFDEVDGCYDAILFSGTLHHLQNLPESIQKINRLLNSNGLMLCQEPYHAGFDKKDASIVALLRVLLSATGNWYETDLHQINSTTDWDALANDILTEYRLERDKHETEGQSPNDLSHDGMEILNELRINFSEKAVMPYYSFIYRFLGGLRGDEAQTHKLADLLTLFDQYATSQKLMNANYFLFAGSKK